MTKNIAFVLKEFYGFDSHVSPIIDNLKEDNYNFFIYHVKKYYPSSKNNINYPNVKVFDLSKCRNINNIIKKHKINLLIYFVPRIDKSVLADPVQK